ncbi:MAG: hypothetical protein AAFO07_11095 [Bacteroidota bacterium]
MKITYTYKVLTIIGLLTVGLSSLKSQVTIPFEKDDNYSASYEEAISLYQELARQHPGQLQLTTHGMTDSGYPLHTAVLSLDGVFEPAAIKALDKRILFINNAIHPGEPCGIEATLLLFRDFLEKKIPQKSLEKVVLVAIPFYNIGGGLNRTAYSRANQKGPVLYGFRGNAKNLDLNRDFIKCDTKNAQTFNQIYNHWKPEVFIDNHTSNGSDYQYTLTLIATQHNKLNPHVAEFMNNTLLPQLYDEMSKTDWEMIPYVYARSTPDKGIRGFLDLPRYSSGYAALHNAISFMPETHMLKPYRGRVKSVYTFMQKMVDAMAEHSEAVKMAYQKAIQSDLERTSFDLNWTLDNEKSDEIMFKGYEAAYKPSLISGKDRLYYDHDKPFEKKIPYFNYYKPTLSVEKPVAYIIPQAYYKVIERLKWNGVEVQQLTEDTELEVDYYYIDDYNTGRGPYEGHYLHSNVKVSTKTMKYVFNKGDYVVKMNQAANRYLISTLEPQAPDAFFAWNFFDGILNQKEYFSSYVFEDLAHEYLEENPDLKAKLEERKKNDPKFAESGRAQLDFVYKNSPYYEATHRRYPVARLIKETYLPMKSN